MQKKYITVEMIDGTIHERVRIVYADQTRYAEVARRHKWGSMEDDPIRFAGFLAYAALTRSNLYDSTKGFDTFIADVADLEPDFGDDEDSSDDLEDHTSTA